MKVWGITGVIGSGKSTAIEHLRSKNFPVIDADQVSRIVVDRKTELGQIGFAQIYKTFGATVLNKLGELDRTAMRKRMMVNPHERDTLEAILHPLIHKHIQGVMGGWKADGVQLGFVEGARLVESKFHDVLGGIVVVTASFENRVKRLVKRDSMGKDEVQLMMGLQDENLMKRFARVEWKNDGSVKQLHKLVDAFVEAKMKEA